MLKLEASYSKKVPVEGQEYSSQSYHCSVEVEIPDGLTADQLRDRIHDTFALVRSSVEGELDDSPALRTPNAVPSRSEPPANGRSRQASGARASAKQIKFLTDLALRQQMDLRTLADEAHRMFSVGRVEDLTRKQASEMIDALNGSSREGGRRRAA
jgi:hypothetical protein